MSHRPVLLCIALLLGCSSSAPSATAAKLAKLDVESFISLGAALEIAQKEVPNGFAIEAELEVEDEDENEPPAFEIEFFVAGENQIIEVEVDAKTGEVLEVEVEDDDEDDEDDEDNEGEVEDGEDV